MSHEQQIPIRASKQLNNSSEEHEELKTELVSVSQLIHDQKLVIPVYQRPYKWTTKNVIELTEDLLAHSDKPSYRLGNIIIHEEHEGEQVWKNIVDGQQRIITFILIARALLERIDEKKHGKFFPRASDIIDPGFKNPISLSNIQSNFNEIKRQVAGFDDDTIDFFFNKCHCVQIKLNNISEAFQFFDAQNARGKDLEPHDLLKAFHLRAFSEEYQEQKKAAVDTWESMQTHELSGLFGKYLFPVKSWAKGDSARFFTKDQTDLFKGFDLENDDDFPYTKLFRIAHYYVDKYNNSYERSIDQNLLDYPFQLDQTILNGRRFFDFVTHYKRTIDSIFYSLKKEQGFLNENAKKIINTLESYEGKNRTGDKYVRLMFDTALIFYIDKFGYHYVSKAIERIFIWSYTLRLRHHTVQLASVDNYVRYELNFIKQIKDSTHPKEVLSIYLAPLRKKEIYDSNKVGAIKDLFTKMNYYAE